MPETKDLRPVVTIRYDKAEDGTYTATMTISGMKNEGQAEYALQMMEAVFCGKQMEMQHAN